MGVQASNQAKLFVISCPVGPYYKTGFKPVKLLADDKNVRAWPGGVGAYKVGANYAPGILVQQAAAEKGCAQVLWLTNDNLTEAGTMNLFVYFINDQGIAHFPSFFFFPLSCNTHHFLQEKRS